MLLRTTKPPLPRAYTAALTVMVFIVPWSAFGNSYLEHARRRYEQLQFDMALSDLSLAQRVPSDDVGERVAILDLTARCQVAVGRFSAAEQTYAELLQQAPWFRLEPSVSPKISAAFSAGRSRAFEPGHFLMTASLSSPRRVTVRLTDPWQRLARLTLTVDRAQLPPLSTELAVSEGGAEGQLPDDANAATWSVDAFDDKGRLLSSARGEVSAVAPTLQPPPFVDVQAGPPRDRQTVRAVAWSATGLALVAAGLGSYFYVRSSSELSGATSAAWADDADRMHHDAARHRTVAWALFGLFGAAAAGATAAWAW